LNSGHEREDERGSPEDSVAEGGAGDGVGGDTGGVVVSGAGNDAGTEAFLKELEGLFHQL